MKVLTREEAENLFRVENDELLGVKFPCPLYDTRMPDELIGEYVTEWGKIFIPWAAVARGWARYWGQWGCYSPISIHFSFDARDPDMEEELKEQLIALKEEVEAMVREGKEVIVQVGNFGASILVPE